MTADEFRSLAMSCPKAVEQEHMGHPDFRVGGKIFATLGPDEAWGMVKLTPEQQASFMKFKPKIFSPASGAWGRKGSTIVHFAEAAAVSVEGAVWVAWCNTAPARLAMIEIRKPFRVRVPVPTRHMGGPMLVDTVAFDGNVVRVTYHKAGRQLGWWGRRTTHEFQWLTDVRSPSDAVKHYADWLSENHKPPLTKAKRRQLGKEAEVIRCGKGEAIYLSPDRAGMYVAGGNNWIYLVSARGTKGALRIPTSVYQSYSISEFEVVGR